MQKRGAVRIVPTNPVTVAIETQGYPTAYGVVANISEAGACFWTNGSFGVGEKLVLRLSFSREPQPFQAAGQIVWSGGSEKGTLRYGVQWAHTSGPQHSRLRRLIGRSVVTPQ
jgi:Tfp pilus assembly protein PilZ